MRQPVLLLHAIRALRRSLLTTGIVTICLVSFGQGTFQKAIGTKGFEKGSALRQLTDGGFIIAGETEGSSSDETDMLLIRTDASGNIKWNKAYGGPEREVINDVVQTSDFGFMFLAEKYQLNKKEGEFLTIGKTDAAGNLLWKKMFDEGGNETEGFSMAATPDGNYVVTGIVKNMNIVSDAFFTMRGEDQNLFLLKVDGNGNKLWSRRLSDAPESISTTGVSVMVAADGSYMLTGNVTKKGKTDKKIEKPLKEESINPEDMRNLLLAKVNSDGSLGWAKEYEANRITAGFSVIEKREGGFVVAGVTTTSADNMDICVLSLAKDGALQWSKTFGGTGFESVSDVLQTAEGGFVISGMSESFASGISDALLFKVDNKGNIRWAKTYGGAGSEQCSRAVLTTDGMVFTGELSSAMGNGSFDVFLMKTDFNGNSECLGTGVSLSSVDFLPLIKGIEKAATTGVEQGITPPGFKKTDVNNINEHRRESSVKNLCD